jgi:hypothetical protein
MKLLTLLVALLAVCPLPAAPDSPPRQAVRNQLPAYSPEGHDSTVADEKAREASRAAAKAAGDADPDMVVLPAMTVEARAVQRMEVDSMYRKGAHDKMLVQRELSAFDRCFLNRFTLPFVGVSKEARAREAYLARKHAEEQERMGRLARLVEIGNPAEAREFRNVLRDASLDNGSSSKASSRSTNAK